VRARAPSRVGYYANSHTHMIFAGSREEEYALRARGATYGEIQAPNWRYLSYFYGVNHVRCVIKRGRVVEPSGGTGRDTTDAAGSRLVSGHPPIAPGSRHSLQ